MKPVRKPSIGGFWYPVLKTKGFSVGSVVWIDHGYHEVRFVGRGVLLVRKMWWVEMWLRRVRGRWRRFWIRRRG